MLLTITFTTLEGRLASISRIKKDLILKVIKSMLLSTSPNDFYVCSFIAKQ
jgi:hypothetical protein